MKALSIKNPWSWIIAHGFKDVENRKWKTNYRGTFLIHSSSKWDSNGSDISRLFSLDQWKSLNDFTQKELITQKNIPCSAIIGQVDLVDCIQNSKSIWAIDGHWHWILENPVFYTNYIPEVKGKLSFWEFNNSLEQARYS